MKRVLEINVFKYRKLIFYFIFSFIVFILIVSVANHNRVTYPMSGDITDVRIDANTNFKIGIADNFHCTWHQNDNVYTVWGDGEGLQGQKPPQSFGAGVSEIMGNPPNLTYSDVWEGEKVDWSCNPKCPTIWNGKSYGIVAIGNTLYMWMGPGSGVNSYGETRMLKSTDHGANWTQSTWKFDEADDWSLPSILQYGAGYTEVPDHANNGKNEYVYSYATHKNDATEFQNESPGKTWMTRVEKNKIMDKDSYQWFTGLDANNQPGWGSMADRKSVFSKKILSWTPIAVSYNAPLKKYIFATLHGQTSVPMCGSYSASKGISFYESDRPWGPWRTIKVIPIFAEEKLYFWNIPTKWISSDGKSMWLVYTGDACGGIKYYAMNFVKINLVVPSLSRGILPHASVLLQGISRIGHSRKPN